jgi:hypothetical protein
MRCIECCPGYFTDALHVCSPAIILLPAQQQVHSYQLQYAQLPQLPLAPIICSTAQAVTDEQLAAAHAAAAEAFAATLSSLQGAEQGATGAGKQDSSSTTTAAAAVITNGSDAAQLEKQTIATEVDAKDIIAAVLDKCKQPAAALSNNSSSADSTTADAQPVVNTPLPQLQRAPDTESTCLSSSSSSSSSSSESAQQQQETVITSSAGTHSSSSTSGSAVVEVDSTHSEELVLYTGTPTVDNSSSGASLAACDSPVSAALAPREFSELAAVSAAVGAAYSYCAAAPGEDPVLQFAVEQMVGHARERTAAVKASSSLTAADSAVLDQHYRAGLQGLAAAVQARNSLAASAQSECGSSSSNSHSGSSFYGSAAQLRAVRQQQQQQQEENNDSDTYSTYSAVASVKAEEVEGASPAARAAGAVLALQGSGSKSTSFAPMSTIYGAGGSAGAEPPMKRKRGRPPGPKRVAAEHAAAAQAEAAAAAAHAARVTTADAAERAAAAAQAAAAAAAAAAAFDSYRDRSGSKGKSKSAVTAAATTSSSSGTNRAGYRDSFGSSSSGVAPVRHLPQGQGMYLPKLNPLRYSWSANGNGVCDVAVPGGVPGKLLKAADTFASNLRHCDVQV